MRERAEPRAPGVPPPSTSACAATGALNPAGAVVQVQGAGTRLKHCWWVGDGLDPQPLSPPCRWRWNREPQALVTCPVLLATSPPPSGSGKSHGASTDACVHEGCSTSKKRSYFTLRQEGRKTECKLTVTQRSHSKKTDPPWSLQKAHSARTPAWGSGDCVRPLTPRAWIIRPVGWLM